VSLNKKSLPAAGMDEGGDSEFVEENWYDAAWRKSGDRHGMLVQTSR